MSKQTMTFSQQSDQVRISTPAISKAARQSGVVLLVSLIMLLLLTLIGITGVQTTSLEEKMAGNMRDRNLAFQAAESALNAAEISLDAMTTADIAANFTGAQANSGTGGFYSSTSSDLAPTATPKVTDDDFWEDNPVVTSTVTTLGNNIVTPVYIIQELGVADCPGAAVGSGLCKNFRIIARATGGSADAVVILQSIYVR